MDWFPVPQATSRTFVPGLEIQALDEAFSLADIEPGNLTEVAGHPGGPQALFQFCEVVGDGGHGACCCPEKYTGLCGVGTLVRRF